MHHWLRFDCALRVAGGSGCGCCCNCCQAALVQCIADVTLATLRVLQVHDAVAADAAGRTVAFDGSCHRACCCRRHIRAHWCVRICSCHLPLIHQTCFNMNLYTYISNPMWGLQLLLLLMRSHRWGMQLDGCGMASCKSFLTCCGRWDRSLFLLLLRRDSCAELWPDVT